MYHFVAIEGNIGVGKTTLASLLSEEFQGQLILEPHQDNPYLPKFYEDNERYAFQLEMTFLLDRYKQIHTTLGKPDIFSNFTIVDYMLPKSLLFSKITLAKDEFKLYRSFFLQVEKKLPKPDLIIYLHASTEQLLKNIKKRGRSYEQSISKVYLNRIERMYMEYFKQHKQQKVVIVDVSDKDWLSDVFAYKQMVEIFKQDYSAGITHIELKSEV